MTLTLVGLGLLPGFSADAEAAMRSSDHVYLEQFTSPIDDHTISKIRDAAGDSFHILRRWQVEDGRKILEDAEVSDVALVSYGDPLTATTHAELLTRAAICGIRVHVLHGASAVTAIPGECGLHHYKMGRMATIMSDPGAVATPYDIILQNMVLGAHTLLLLEYDHEGKTFLGPSDAISLLLSEAESRRAEEISPDTFAVVVSRIGRSDHSVIAGRMSSLQEEDFGDPPHGVIVPGRLHFTEHDSIRALAHCIDEPADNSDRIKSVSARMLAKYLPMIKDAIKVEETRSTVNGAGIILENARCYAADAETFLAQNKSELAVLSIGYADGLVDALRMIRGEEPIQTGQ